MKLWKTILLQTGIFTAVFALGLGAGFLSCYKKKETKEPDVPAAAQENTELKELTHSAKFLSNLTNAKTIEGDIDIAIRPISYVEEAPIKRDLSLDNIDLSISNLEVSIADLDNIKLAGDINVKTGVFDLDLSVGFFDNTIYLDCFDTHFYLKTDDISDVMDMLPTFGVDFTVPSEFTDLDFDALLKALAKMKEVKTEEEHYFTFQFSEDITIKFLTNDKYEMVGVELPETELMGMKISATSDLHCLKEETTNLVNPMEGENASLYREFKPAFSLINHVIDLVDAKSANMEVSLDIDKVGEEVTDFVDINGELDFDLSTLNLYTDLIIEENNRSHHINAALDEGALFLGVKNLKVSMKLGNVFTLVSKIMDKTNSGSFDEVLDNLSDVSSEIDLSKILPYLNDLPEFISDFDLSSNYLSLTFNPRYFDIPVDPFGLKVTFDENSISSLEVSNVRYSDYLINASIELSEYEYVYINQNEYVQLDPALSLVDTVDNLIHQDRFGANFNVSIDDGDETTRDVTLNGQFEFALKYDESKGGLHKNFDYGAGVLNITDGDNYPHKIIADAQEEGRVLLSYSGTSGNKTNAKFDNETLDSIFDMVSELMASKDDHLMELLGGLMDQAETTPLAMILEGQYGVLLDADFITSLDVTPTAVTLGLNGAIIGMEDINFTLVIRYNDSTIEGADIYGLNLGGKILNMSFELHEFDTDFYNQHRLQDNSSFIDLSTLALFLRLGLNTSEFNYYHFNGPITLNVADLFDAITMQGDIKIVNKGGHVKVLAHLTEIPVNLLFSADYSLSLNREAYLMYDNVDKVFYINRHDYRPEKKVLGVVIESAIDNNLYLRCTEDYFMDNVLDILCGHVLGLSSSILNRIGGMSMGEGQIQYENIVKGYSYNASDKNFYFAINVGELAKSDSLETLSLNVYHNGEKLNRAVIDLGINVLITLHLHMDMSLQSDSSVAVSGQEVSFMDDYVARHYNDTINTILH